MNLQEARTALAVALGGTNKKILAPRKSRGKREHILIFGDLHLPFANKDALAKLFQVKADRVFIAGDLLDGYSISKYVRYRDVPLLDELAAGKAFLERAAETWPAISIIEGNHDVRLAKLIRQKLEPDVVEALTVLAGGSLSPVAAIARDIPNIEIVGHSVDDHSVRWFHAYGDLLICHADRFNAKPGAAVQGVFDWFRRMQKQLRLKPFRVICQAHTHQLLWCPYEADSLLLESGCLAQTQGYMLDPKVAGLPQRLGWIELEMSGGHVDLASVKLTWLE